MWLKTMLFQHHGQWCIYDEYMKPLVYQTEELFLLTVKVLCYDMGVYGEWLTYKIRLRWPFEEVQTLTLQRLLHFSANIIWMSLRKRPSVHHHPRSCDSSHPQSSDTNTDDPSLTASVVKHASVSSTGAIRPWANSSKKVMDLHVWGVRECVTWSAKEVDSMLISSLSAVNLHICSHLSFRSRSRRSRITPGKHAHTAHGAPTHMHTHTFRQRYGSLRNREISILLPGKGDKVPSWGSESQPCVFWDKAVDFKLGDRLPKHVKNPLGNRNYS